MFQKRLAELQQNGTLFEGISILSLEPGSRKEQAVCAGLLLTMPQANIVPVRSLSNLVDDVSQASFVLSERYHGALAAFALGVPFEAISQQPGDKLASLMEEAKEEGVERCRERVEEGVKALMQALRHIQRV
jgi:polysaccharide pyruvyl transferase WcaK-like protein